MKKDLWVRLKKYRFGNLVPVSLADRVRGMFGENDAFTRAFAAKVAKKNKWTDEFAFQAVREYKKFVFLGVTSHYPVTPSSVIDKVWHEHQLFTQGYREFCRDVLHAYFDHSPELIPFDVQTEVFNAQYQKTLDFYEHEFGVEPPPEIWGQPKFDPKKVKGTVSKPDRRRNDLRQSMQDKDEPLHTMFTSNDSTYAPIPVIFSGQGGTSGGAGASGSWDAPAAQPASESSSSNASSCSSSSSASSCSSSSSSSSCSSGGGSSCGGGSS